MKEAAWQRQVLELATWYGWAHFHPYEMRRADPGWPDLTLVRPGELIFAELKTDRGRLTAAQVEWGELLGTIALAAPGIVDYHIWRPRDFEAVHQRLRHRMPLSAHDHSNGQTGKQQR